MRDDITGCPMTNQTRPILKLILFIASIAATLLTVSVQSMTAWAQEQTGPRARIVALQIIPNGPATCFEVISVGQLAADVYTAATPQRMVIDIRSADFVLKHHPKQKLDAIASGFRYGILQNGLARIVADVANDVQIADVSSSQIGTDGYRLSVELRKSGGSHAPVCRTKPDAMEAATASNTTGHSRRHVIVIDPGHGGVDPGAVVNKVYLEKLIVLAVARRLEELLKRQQGMHVVMTRRDDTFVPLDNRVEISRQHAASVFISLHADSIPSASKSAGGAVVYTLSDEASDEEARRLAEKENAADLRAGLLPKAAETESPVRTILVDLLKRETQQDSARLAKLLVSSMRGEVHLSRRPVRSAAFRVLKQTETPGVLIELGFMTNPNDLRRMRQAEWQQRMATTIAAAVQRFLAERRKR